MPTMPSIPSIQPVQPVNPNPVSPNNVADFSEGSKSGPVAPLTGKVKIFTTIFKRLRYLLFFLHHKFLLFVRN